MHIHCDCAESCCFLQEHGHRPESLIKEKMQRYCASPDGSVECVRRLVLRIYGTQLDCQVDPDGNYLAA